MPTPSSRWTLRATARVIIKELSAFGVVGGVSFVVDLAVFQWLITQTEVGAVNAKLVAAIVSTTTAFLGHRFWSFSHRSHSRLTRDYVRFALVNGVTLALSLSVVAFVRYPLGQEGALALQAANVLSIALGTVVRFLFYRGWVFPAPSGRRPRTPIRSWSPPLGSRQNVPIPARTAARPRTPPTAQFVRSGRPRSGRRRS